MPRNPNCDLCPLHKGAQTVCVWGQPHLPDEEAKAVIVLESPNREEDRRGIPNLGMNGKVLPPLIAKIDNAYVTHLVKCITPNGRPPTPDEIKACRPYLDEELADYAGKALVTLGSLASKVLLRKSKVTIDHGQIFERDGRLNMPAYQPSYVMRDPSKQPELEADFERLGRRISGEDKLSRDVPWAVVGQSTVRQFFREISEADEFAFDTETTGTFPYDRKGRVRCLAIAVAKRAWVIPLGMGDESVFKTLDDQVKFLRLVAQVLADKRGVAHNGKFDNHWLYVYAGIVLPLTFDTMLAHHMIDENSPHGLKELSRKYLDVEDYDLTIPEKTGAKWVDPFKLYEYCGKDAMYTLWLKQIFDKKLREDIALRKLFYRLTMRASRAFHDIELNGLYVNLPKFDETYDKVMEELETSLAGLNQMVKNAAHGAPVNWNSPDQVSKFLYGTLGLAPTVFTDGGKPSTGEAALLDIRSQHPVAEALVKYRELEKFRSTYLDGWRELMVGPMIHFSYKLHGTVTGRYSCRLHQVPRDGTIRNLIESPDGWTFVQGDFSQAEVRIAAELSGDPELMRCFLEGIDVHWKTLLNALASGGAGEYVKPALETATSLEERTIRHLDEATEILLEHGHDKAIALWKGWKEARKKAKGIVFGYIYGMSAEGFVSYAKLNYGFEPTLDEAIRFREAFFHLYSRLEGWHDKYRKLTKLNGYVRNLAGRKRRLPGVYSPDRYLSSEALRQGINSPVQGFIGDWKAMALVEIHENFDRDELRIVGEVHDSLLMWVRTEKKDEVLPDVKRIMEKPALLQDFGIKIRVPMKADIEVGPWGAGKGWKP